MPENTKDKTNYYKSKPPLSKTEQIFYHKLIEALPEYIVLAQVQLSSIIGIKESKKLIIQRLHYKWLNPILQQSVDFLVCLKDFTIVAAIELDDKSHWGEKSINRDNKKDKNLEAAGINLIRWHAESMPSVEEIKQEFHATPEFHNYEHIKTNIPSTKTAIKILTTIIMVSIFIWLIKIAISELTPSNLQKIASIPFQKMQTQIQENSKQQKEKSQAIETAQIAALPAKQREELKRNLLWKQQYSPPTQCINTMNAYMVSECLKYEKRARTQFENSLNGKEEYWAKYYTPSTKCLHIQSALQELECNNEKNNMRKNFEKDWQTKINNGWQPSPLN